MSGFIGAGAPAFWRKSPVGQAIGVPLGMKPEPDPAPPPTLLPASDSPLTPQSEIEARRRAKISAERLGGGQRRASESLTASSLGG